MPNISSKKDSRRLEKREDDQFRCDFWAEVFCSLDKDGDGKVSYRQLRAKVEEIGRTSSALPSSRCYLRSVEDDESLINLEEFLSYILLSPPKFMKNNVERRMADTPHPTHFMPDQDSHRQ